MANHKRIAIDINENGYTVTVFSSKKKFVFSNTKTMNKWLRKNLSLTGEIERFSDALDNDEKNDTMKFEHRILNGMNINPVIGASLTTTVIDYV